MFAVSGIPSEPAHVNRLVVPLFGVPKRHCCRVSAADKRCRVYPLDPCPDAVALYSGCTPGKRRAWFLPDNRHTASIVGLHGGWRHARTKMFTRTCGSEYAVPGPKLPTIVKAGYLNCKISLYIPNSLRCLKCQMFGHSQTSCRGQLTCSRCSFVGHSSRLQFGVEMRQLFTTSFFRLKTVSQMEKLKKEIQVGKTNRNVSYLEARNLNVSQLSQTDAQVTKPSVATSTTQTDENITKIKFSTLQLIQPLLSVPPPNASPSVSLHRLPLRQTSCLPYLQ
ncbi:uncharacterized protein TNCV_2496181 [Trichonephila clavipes]|nr:uncharacterized protein TNCV_2496181 [Trichonephila clavipes]